VLSFDDIAKGREVAVLIHNEIAKVYLGHGNSQKAEEAWLKASAIDPMGVQSRIELAALYERTDRNRAALRVCEQLCSIEPRNAAYWSNVGVLNARLGRYDAALAAVGEAMKLDPANPEYRHAQELIRSAQ
jgi:tetratricopeptide (TPR) repeat protein